MRRAIAWFLAGLPFDARSRRAIDETLLDWEGEATALRQAQGREARPLEATVIELRGAVSILRVTSLSVLREIVDLRWVVSLGWRFATLFGFAFLMAFPSTLTYADSDRALLLLTLSLLPSTIASLLPLALLLVVAWRPPAGRGPAVGGVMLVVVGTLALVGWIIPSSLQGFREMVFWILMNREGQISAGLRSVQASPSVLQLAGWICLNGALALFASALAQQGGLRSRVWLPVAPLGLFATYAGISWATASALRSSGIAGWTNYDDPLAMIVVAMGVAVMAFWYHHRAGSDADATPAATQA